MAAVNCPLCDLRFATKNERDDHLRTEHGQHHLHRPVPHAPAPPAPPVPTAEEWAP